jgi:tetratricopeptide (TPR) repeat protein
VIDLRRFACFLLVLAPLGGPVAQVHDPRALNADPGSAEHPIAPRLAGLGDYQFPVSSSSAESRYFVAQGLRLTYGFNHSEALRAFKEAIRLDPDNAMAYWGWALVLGPNLNLPMMPDVVEQAYGAIQIAMSMRERVTPRERGFIEALATRYVPEPVDDREALDILYADAMRALASQFPGDADVATLYAASLMNLTPWEYWDREGNPGANTETLLAQLELAMAIEPEHPGALHYYIHALESVEPTRAEFAADRLLPLMPGAGHLVHMPAHIYMRLGRYADSYAANYMASLADESYIVQCRAQGIYPLGYYPHNLHFLVWSAMFLGRREAALDAARKIANHLRSEDEAAVQPFDEPFLAQPLFAMVRFGQWDGVLAEKPPPSGAFLWTGIWHYARTLAFLGAGNSRKAAAESRSLQAILDDPAFAEYAAEMKFADRLLTIASEISLGELSRIKGQYSVALAHLERATRLEDALPYNEPPDWYFPVRHYLGAALLDAGYPEEAEVVYWADLRKYPANGYSLLGLAQSLKAQGHDSEAVELRQRYEAAWQSADGELTSSRY